MNDKKLCKIAMKVVSERRSDTYKVVGSPDEHERQKKAVDLECLSQEGTHYFIEHTQLESFPEQIYDSARFLKDLVPLENYLQGTLPKPGFYCLSLNIYESKQIKKPEEISLIIKNWIIKNAGKLKIPAFQNDPSSILKEKPNGLDFEITLRRKQSLPSLEGKLLLERSISQDHNLYELCKKRIEKALDEKCPKLSKAKNYQSISILCLELTDKGLGSITDTSKVIISAIHEREDDIPDHILLVDTRSDTIIVKIVKEEEIEFPNISNDLVRVDQHDV